MILTQYQFVSAYCDGDILIVRLDVDRLFGDDLVGKVEAELCAVAREFAGEKVIIDLQCVKEISSRGVGGLAVFHSAFVKKGGGVVALCNLRPFVADVLTTVRFVTSNGSWRLAHIAPSGVPAEASSPPTRVLFEHIAADVPAAISVLSKLT